MPFRAGYLNVKSGAEALGVICFNDLTTSPSPDFTTCLFCEYHARMLKGSSPLRLLVFSDDWGRHPSSCQHLISHLLPRYPTLWVNTIGMRRPTLSRDDLGKIWKRLRDWGQQSEPLSLPDNLRVIAPRMWPGFRTAWQRHFNARSMSRSIVQALPPPVADNSMSNAPVIAVTTLPIVADLVGRLPVDRWVYYCVDDFSVWPGVDGSVMDTMERELVAKVDHALAVSPTLQHRLAAMGRESDLLTHGIDLHHWQNVTTQSLQPEPPVFSEKKTSSLPLPDWCHGLPRPILLFWGLIDPRLDVSWCRALVEQVAGTLVLAGPMQSPSPDLLQLVQQYGQREVNSSSFGDAAGVANAAGNTKGSIVLPGPMRYDLLPTLAQWADVLVMPYADLPVTRAMQPLKFKEYLAAGYPDAGKPVVARALPALTDWADAADLVQTAQQAVTLVHQRLQNGLPMTQQQARLRLADETWANKALKLEARLVGN